VGGTRRSRAKSRKQPAAISQIAQAKKPTATNVASETTPSARLHPSGALRYPTVIQSGKRNADDHHSDRDPPETEQDPARVVEGEICLGPCGRELVA